MQNKPANTINLFKGRGKSSVDKIIAWSLTFGRAIVIITEAVALAAFLYRFTLDREIIDLQDSIEQKQAVVKLLSSNETKFRNLQDRIAIATQLSSEGNITTTTITDIINRAPSDVIINNITFSGANIKIDADVLSISSLTTFVNALKTYPAIQTVSLDKVENKTSNAVINIVISTTLKTNK